MKEENHKLTEENGKLKEQNSKLVEEDNKLNFIYDVFKGRHDAEIDRRKELDEKADRIIQCVSIVTGITIGLGIISSDKTLALPQLHMSYFSGIALLIMSIVASLVASRVMAWREAPDIGLMMKWRTIKEMTEEKMKKKAILDLNNAIIKNSKNNGYKAFSILFSWGFMLAGLITLGIFLYLFVQTTVHIAK